MPTNYAGFRFSKCHTENPELSFYGMNDGDEFECLTCDEKLRRLSAEVQNGSFVKMSKSSNNYGNANFYELKCDDGRVEARYKCFTR